ncbi:hypothetical protein SAZ10_13395 [Mesorhizobium sp. BAC0120]|uniref:hypothetical protein n=1 Tax=Mesorhizobium sp. BAC0120 TaxID=3090670 RepID=UPI00298C168E|nr:hypothetical protein [Mesorhizobium sp. BAC0120]MDW6022752.1 hypothetical protein [Mesorhizobium sp. BAC0120]
MADEVSLPQPPTFDEIVGLRLSIVRRAADMLILHFGEVVLHRSGKGDVGQIALHIQGPWRLEDLNNTIVGRDDLWEYGGTHPQPEGWRYEDGESVQDDSFDRLFRRGEGKYG